MNKKYVVVDEDEIQKMKKEKHDILKIIGVFSIIMLVIMGIFYILQIMTMVFIIGFGLIAGLFIFFVYLGGGTETKWVSKDEMLDEEEAIKQFEKDEGNGLLEVEDK